MFRTICLITLFTLAAGAARAVTDTETTRQSFAAQPKLEVRNINGLIKVTGSGSNRIELVATKHIEADDSAALARAKTDVKLDVQESGGRLKLCVVYASDATCNDQGTDRRHWRDRGYDVRYDLELQVPRRIELALQNVNGAVDVEKIQGAFDVQTVNGPLTMSEIEGSGTAHTVNGAIKLAFSAAPRDRVDVQTVNGEIQASFPKSANANLRFQTMHGEVYTDFPEKSLVIEASAPARGRAVRIGENFTARLGGGGPEYQFQTLNGSIQIAGR